MARGVRGYPAKMTARPGFGMPGAQYGGYQPSGAEAARWVGMQYNPAAMGGQRPFQGPITDQGAYSPGMRSHVENNFRQSGYGDQNGSLASQAMQTLPYRVGSPGPGMQTLPYRPGGVDPQMEQFAAGGGVMSIPAADVSPRRPLPNPFAPRGRQGQYQGPDAYDPEPSVGMRLHGDGYRSRGRAVERGVPGAYMFGRSQDEFPAFIGRSHSQPPVEPQAINPNQYGSPIGPSGAPAYNFPNSMPGSVFTRDNPVTRMSPPTAATRLSGTGSVGGSVATGAVQATGQSAPPRGVFNDLVGDPAAALFFNPGNQPSPGVPAPPVPNPPRPWAGGNLGGSLTPTPPAPFTAGQEYGDSASYRRVSEGNRSFMENYRPPHQSHPAVTGYAPPTAPGTQTYGRNVGGGQFNDGGQPLFGSYGAGGRGLTADGVIAQAGRPQQAVDGRWAVGAPGGAFGTPGAYMLPDGPGAIGGGPNFTGMRPNFTGIAPSAGEMAANEASLARAKDPADRERRMEILNNVSGGRFGGYEGARAQVATQFPAGGTQINRPGIPVGTDLSANRTAYQERAAGRKAATQAAAERRWERKYGGGGSRNGEAFGRMSTDGMAMEIPANGLGMPAEGTDGAVPGMRDANHPLAQMVSTLLDNPKYQNNPDALRAALIQGGANGDMVDAYLSELNSANNGGFWSAVDPTGTGGLAAMVNGYFDPTGFARRKKHISALTPRKKK